jgi:hypothetical protein
MVWGFNPKGDPNWWTVFINPIVSESWWMISPEKNDNEQNELFDNYCLKVI